jgi:hypothetical protein
MRPTTILNIKKGEMSVKQSSVVVDFIGLNGGIGI